MESGARLDWSDCRRNLLVQFDSGRRVSEDRLQNEVKILLVEINWDYAVFERLDPLEVRSQLIPFILGKAVLAVALAAIGFGHNYIAHVSDRASVMDYPYPLITLDAQGRLDISDAYRNSGGAHDTLAIRYGYSWFRNAAEEAAGLSRIVRDAEERGLRFVADEHAIAAGSIPSARDVARCTRSSRRPSPTIRSASTSPRAAAVSRRRSRSRH